MTVEEENGKKFISLKGWNVLDIDDEKMFYYDRQTFYSLKKKNNNKIKQLKLFEFYRSLKFEKNNRKIIHNQYQLHE